MEENTLTERQLMLEREMVSISKECFDSDHNNKISKGNVSSTNGGKHLLNFAIKPFSKILTGEIEAESSPGRRCLSLSFLSRFKPELVAYVTASCVINSLSKGNSTIRSLSVEIGNWLEDELKLEKFDEENPNYFSAINKDLNRRTRNTEHRHRVFTHSINKTEFTWESWSKHTQIHIGARCLDIFIEATGWFTKDLKQISLTKRELYLSPTQDFFTFFGEHNQFLAEANPRYLPMIISPLDWVSIDEGAYLTNEIKSCRFVKHLSKNIASMYSKENIPYVYRAVNAIQSTAWKINSDVYEVARYFWQDTNSTICSYPERDDLPLPSKPEDIESNDFSREEWRHRASEVYERNRSLVSKRISVINLLSLSSKFKDEEAIYFPHNIDRRGRAYPIPSSLTPQGDDLSKGLLIFSKGKALDESGSRWLAIHGANCFGESKRDIQGRLEWINANTENIIKSAENPTEFTWWAEADEPWQFLAFCFEWKGYCEEGFDYVSHLAVSVDGTCNGYQHLAALSKDASDAKAVNLITSESLNDIYSDVAESLIRQLEKSSKSGDSLAKRWLESRLIGRSICKSPVMTIPYGATKEGVRKSIETYMSDNSDERLMLLFEGNYKLYSSYLSDKLFKSVSVISPGAMGLRNYLRDISQLSGKEDKYIEWKTPIGLVYKNIKNKSELLRVKVRLCGLTRIGFKHYIENSFDKRKQNNSIVPDLVHSLDASHMMTTVNMCLEEGIDCFHMIHDSFGTHASDMQRMNEILREAFVSQYTNNSILDHFRRYMEEAISEKNQDKIPAPIETGELDISQVLESEYFFN